ncbi:hypothetical protein [Schaalia vaccimaxillae]|uniref:hypothetical protein n=1 Tax=Schaalia vaccimaxillae TaxID=183916 RepID=UPI0003B38BE5|nr:hypothetical protein [Schaalia vaccimaxillae]
MKKRMPSYRPYYGAPITRPAPYTPLERLNVALSLKRLARELQAAGKAREAELVEEIAEKVRIGEMTL